MNELEQANANIAVLQNSINLAEKRRMEQVETIEKLMGERNKALDAYGVIAEKLYNAEKELETLRSFIEVDEATP